MRERREPALQNPGISYVRFLVMPRDTQMGRAICVQNAFETGLNCRRVPMNARTTGLIAPWLIWALEGHYSGVLNTGRRRPGGLILRRSSGGE